MRYELTDFDWAAIRSFLPNKPRGIPRAEDRRVLDVKCLPIHRDGRGNSSFRTSVAPNNPRFPAL
jgi:transposase